MSQKFVFGRFLDGVTTPDADPYPHTVTKISHHPLPRRRVLLERDDIKIDSFTPEPFTAVLATVNPTLGATGTITVNNTQIATLTADGFSWHIDTLTDTDADLEFTWALTGTRRAYRHAGMPTVVYFDALSITGHVDGISVTVDGTMTTLAGNTVTRVTVDPSQER